ncbi:alpha/beta hydrolase [Tamilnaduibacter salinus]|nr:alpha/beta hydrolase [Tamilnaduibacter salinus]
MSRVTASDGVQLHAVAWGDDQKTPVVLVHGYPDAHTVWTDIAHDLARDHYVVAYDVRGAGASDRPSRIRAYRMEQLASDLAHVVDQMLPGRSFHLAGHDWGAIQSWESVTQGALKDRILSYTAISGPSLDHAGQWLRSQLRRPSLSGLKKLGNQLAHSWYIGLFHLPVAAPLAWETLVGRYWPDILKRIEGVEESRPSPTRTRDGMDGIRLYRANILPRLLRAETGFASCPVQVVLPRQDHFVRPQLMEGMERWVPELSFQEVDGGHWLLLTHPAVVADTIRRMTQPERRKAAA